MQKWKEVQGVYIHTPFCVQKCLYCDFASVAGQSEDVVQAYIKAVSQEISLKQVALPVADKATIYFGGGTPSLLSVELLQQLVVALKENNWWKNPAEVTIEVNPGTADLDKMKELRKMGFDRISFGVQSLQDKELRLIGRIHNAEEALAAITTAQKAGFKRISADLIYGLPGQTQVSFSKTLNQIMATGIQHISVYGLTIEEGTPLQRLVNAGELVLPTEDETIAMYELTQEILKQYGLERYEISNYAAPGQGSLHNLVYWQYLPYMAFGSAACSFDGKHRWNGIWDVKDYMNKSRHKIWSEEKETLDQDTQLAEYLFMGLRTKVGIDLKITQTRFNCNIMEKFGVEIQRFLDNGFLILEKKDARLRLSEQGMRFGNEVFEIFVK